MCDILKQLESAPGGLEVCELSSKCRYHKKSPERFSHNRILKDFKCLELFHTVYPKILALMYDGEFVAKELMCKCPNAENTVTVRLYSKPVRSISLRILNRIKQILYPIRPMDVVNCTVYIEVLSSGNNCFVGYKEKDVFQIHHTGTICPQALYSAFPLVLVPKKNYVCQCPSHVNKVVFKRHPIKRSEQDVRYNP